MKGEYFNVYMRCIGIQTFHYLQLEPLLSRESEYSFFSSQSFFSFEYPVYHCVLNKEYKTNPILSLPENCTLSVKGELPPGFTLTPNGVLIGNPTSTLEKTDYTVYCQDMPYQTSLSLIVSGMLLNKLLNRSGFYAIGNCFDGRRDGD